MPFRRDEIRGRVCREDGEAAAAFVFLTGCVSQVGQSIGGVAPALRDYTNGVLFDDLCRRPGPSPRDRSLVTVSALIASDKGQQFVGHINRSLDNGETRAEVGAVVTQLAFYVEWPNAVSATAVAQGVFDERP